MALCDAPRQRDLRAVLAVFLGDGGDGGVLDEFAHVLARAVDGVLVAEGGVLLDVDVFGFVVGGEGGLLEPGVEFDLVRGGDDGSFAQEALEFGVAEVGDADGFGLAALEGFLHGFPCEESWGQDGWFWVRLGRWDRFQRCRISRLKLQCEREHTAKKRREDSHVST